MDLVEVIRYGWVVLSGIFVFLLKSLDAANKEKLRGMDKDHADLKNVFQDKSSAQDREIVRISMEIVRLEAEKITREHLDKVMSTYFDRIDKRLDDLSEEIRHSTTNRNS